MKKDSASLLILVTLCFGIPALLFQFRKNSALAASGHQHHARAADEVLIENMAFNQALITVPLNTTVRWSNQDGAAHTVTSATGAFDSGNIGVGGTYLYQFTRAGTYPYKCSYHASMTGTVVVQ